MRNCYKIHNYIFVSYLTKMTWCWIILTVILLLTGRWGRQKSPVPPSSPSSLRRNRCSSTKDLTLSNPYSGKLQQKVSMGNYELNSKYDFDVIFESLRKPEHHFFTSNKNKIYYKSTGNITLIKIVLLDHSLLMFQGWLDQ